MSADFYFGSAAAVQPDGAWYKGTSHANAAHTVRLLGNNNAPQGGLNIIQLCQGTSTGPDDATDFLVLDSSTQTSFRIGSTVYASIWSHGILPGFFMSKPRIQFVNTIATGNVLIFYEAINQAAPVSNALILKGQSATGVTAARAGAIVMEAGDASVSGGGGAVATGNDARVNPSNVGGLAAGNVAFGYLTGAVDDATDVPPLAAGGMTGGWLLNLANTPATAAPAAGIAIWFDGTNLKCWRAGAGAAQIII